MLHLVQPVDVPVPETLHNLVIYFKFCLFGTVWGHTAHATDPNSNSIINNTPYFNLKQYYVGVRHMRRHHPGLWP